MQFLLGGYSFGHPGLVMEPLSLVRKPPQAAAGWEAPSARHVPRLPGIRDAARSGWGDGEAGEGGGGGDHSPSQRRLSEASS